MTSGKVRYVGASNYSGWQLQKSIDLARANGWEPVVCLQALYNLLDRDAEYELLYVVQNEGLGMSPVEPASRWLARAERYRRGMNAPVAGTRIEVASEKGWSETFERYNNERTWNVIDTIARDQQETGKTSGADRPELAAALPPGVTGPIIGARNMTQLEDNLGASRLAAERTSDAEVEHGEQSQPAPYPYDVHRLRLGI